ncbi:hypothetical protein PCASD_11296 [Puccinia coronata f. sp. avenae]|uniref:Uncharacterized protein n=1 Tax=Puccinia coronata f. sp. avenae TaxID=200324 RepID=A0A2N5UJ89_9BASI|nr:hypothetical protein PCASD_11296 [Puccinia coronata f. sp. avenae]
MNRSPNHPMLASGLFEALTSSVTDAPAGNMYSNLQTPSLVQCGGLDGGAALSAGLEASATYFLACRLMATNNRVPPFLTYSLATATQLPEGVTGSVDMTNRKSIIGLGHVVSWEDVTTNQRDSTICLEVIIAHNDWDTERKIHRQFLAKYVVPGTKNYIKTHLLYQPGQELQVVGSLVDFEQDSNMPVVLISLYNSEQIRVYPLSPTAAAILAGEPKLLLKVFSAFEI